MSKRISVIITVYNVRNYMDMCIESVINQTYRNLEVILVDDGSTDGSSQKCDEWGKRDRRIRVIHKENEGAVSARRAGAEAAIGDYIGFVDADDWIEPDMYQLMADMGIMENVDIVSVEDIREYEDGRSHVERIRLEEGIYRGEDFLNDILVNMIDTETFFQWNIPMHGWQHLFKSGLLKRNQELIDLRIRRGEDLLSALSCYIDAKSAALLKKPLYHYRQVSKSAKNTATKRNLEGLIYLTDRMLNIGRNNLRRHDVVEQEIRYCIFYTLLWSAYEICLTADSTELFPYGVPKHSKVAVIGAGAFGARLYKRIKELEFCQISIWADNGWAACQKRGLPVEGFNRLNDIEFDYAVIAVLDGTMQRQIVEKLKDKQIESEKIKIPMKESISDRKLHEIIHNIEANLGL